MLALTRIKKFFRSDRARKWNVRLRVTIVLLAATVVVLGLFFAPFISPKESQSFDRAYPRLFSYQPGWGTDTLQISVIENNMTFDEAVELAMFHECAIVTPATDFLPSFLSKRGYSVVAKTNVGETTEGELWCVKSESRNVDEEALTQLVDRRTKLMAQIEAKARAQSGAHLSEIERAYESYAQDFDFFDKVERAFSSNDKRREFLQSYNQQPANCVDAIAQRVAMETFLNYKRDIKSEGSIIWASPICRTALTANIGQALQEDVLTYIAIKNAQDVLAE